MSAFEITENHLKVLSVIILHGGVINEGHLHPHFANMLKGLADNSYLDTEMQVGRFGDVTIYSLNKVSLEIVQTYGHQVLDGAIDKVVNKLKGGS